MNATFRQTAPAASLSCDALDVCVPGRRLVHALSLQLKPGDFVCVLGPNGVGKTLTLHTLAGLRAPSAGEVRVDGHVIARLDRRRVAAALGLLLQSQDDAFPTTVLDCAMLGRFSRLGLWQWESSDDLAAARDALRAMDLQNVESRLAATLSGGERRRLGLATLLVQDPQVLLLDEPLNHLDPLHRFLVLQKLASLQSSGRAILASIHDPAIAGLFATSVLVLYGDGRWEFGPAGEMLTATRLEALYETRFARFTSEDSSVLLPMPPMPRLP
jgi:iron complex transport system ATP-binding protein